MSSSRIAKKYARALFETMRNEKDLAPEFLQTLDTIEQIFGEPKFRNVFKSPVIQNDVKRDVIKDILANIKAPSQLNLFVNGVAAAGRSRYLAEIIKEFRSLWAISQGIIEVHVTSAAPLSAEQEKSLSEVIAKISNSKVQLEKSVEPQLIGGMVLTVGNSRLDLSLKKKISDFAKNAMN